MAATLVLLLVGWRIPTRVLDTSTSMLAVLWKALSMSTFAALKFLRSCVCTVSLYRRGGWLIRRQYRRIGPHLLFHIRHRELTRSNDIFLLSSVQNLQALCLHFSKARNIFPSFIEFLCVYIFFVFVWFLMIRRWFLSGGVFLCDIQSAMFICFSLSICVCCAVLVRQPAI